MQLRLHNTLTRRKEPFTPLDPARVRMYVCGPTVYQRIHVGNARPFVVFDVLFRLLRHLHGADHVVYVRNITDIDDKIIDQARKNGEDIRTLTERTTREFHEDMAALGCLPPTHEPRATEHIEDMIRLIEALIARGHAYAAEGHVLFHVPSMPAYGRLSGRSHEEQIAGARVEVAPYKRDPADFVLWKPSDPKPERDAFSGWDSPWGRGRPGWHIECSAMSERWLGVPFDIHAGGLDLIFPHHENEIAQSCCAHGLDVMARFWLHNGFLDMRGEKMSKSLGNVVRVPEALAVVHGDAASSGEAVRLLLLETHYRQPSNYTEEAVIEADRKLVRFYNALRQAGVRGPAVLVEEEPDPAILEVLADDLNTPRAIVETLPRLLGELSRTNSPAAAARLRTSASLLGLLQDDPDQFLKRPRGAVASVTPGVLTLKPADGPQAIAFTHEQIQQHIDERTAARKRKDFRRADEIRDQLRQVGVILEDRPDGTTDWHT